MQINIALVSSAFVRQSLDPVAVYREALRQSEERNPEVYVQNPGLAALAETVGYQSRTLDEAKSEFDRATRIRVANAKTYMDEVAAALNPAGKAHGILANAVRACEGPSELTDQQKEIWGSPAEQRLLISKPEIVRFITALAQTKFQVGNQVESGAQILADQFASVGTAESQMWTAAMATAAEGNLTERTLGEIFNALNHESAQFSELPEAARRAATAFQIAVGNRYAFSPTSRDGSDARTGSTPTGTQADGSRPNA